MAPSGYTRKGRRGRSGGRGGVGTPKKREASEPQRFERAQWLTARLLEDILGGGLVTASVRSVDFYGKPSMEQVRITLSQKEGRYFALTREDGRFESLIDREPLLEEVARSAVQESTIR